MMASFRELGDTLNEFGADAEFAAVAPRLLLAGIVVVAE
jgi:hypothetical protein